MRPMESWSEWLGAAPIGGWVLIAAILWIVFSLGVIFGMTR